MEKLIVYVNMNINSWLGEKDGRYANMLWMYETDLLAGWGMLLSCKLNDALSITLF